MKIWATWTQKDIVSEMGIEYNEEVSRETALNDLERIASKLFQGRYDCAWHYDGATEETTQEPRPV